MSKLIYLLYNHPEAKKDCPRFQKKQAQIDFLIKPGCHLVAYVSFCSLMLEMKLGGYIKMTNVQGMELEVPRMGFAIWATIQYISELLLCKKTS